MKRRKRMSSSEKTLRLGMSLKTPINFNAEKLSWRNERSKRWKRNSLPSGLIGNTQRM
jgi:hypothetical protein